MKKSKEMQQELFEIQNKITMSGKIVGGDGSENVVMIELPREFFTSGMCVINSRVKVVADIVRVKETK